MHKITHSLKNYLDGCLPSTQISEMFYFKEKNYVISKNEAVIKLYHPLRSTGTEVYQSVEGLPKQNKQTWWV